MAFKNTLLPVATSIVSQGRLFNLSKPVVMGILNATPDSFYTSSTDLSDILHQAERMLKEEASILDIGGASSRPGAPDIPASEEIRRIEPVIAAISSRFPDTWISIDTFHASVAEAAIHAGAHIINDISGGRDELMIETIARLRVPYIAMHMQGIPRTMQQDPQYDDVVREVFDYLRDIVLRCKAAGIHDLIIDPGFGFGKTVSHNYSLLNNLGTLRVLGKPVLAGLSRKSMICKPLGVNPDKALTGTTALHMVALREGASILRAHDVKQAVETIKLYHQIQESE
jgi:dihydropteroate synthase